MGFLLRTPDEGDEGGDSVVCLTNVFDFLRLGYRVEWPCNIVLTEAAVADYGCIFAFLLQLRKAVWALEQVFLNLKDLSECKTWVSKAFSTSNYITFFIRRL